jgi:hypothetical protein
MKFNYNAPWHQLREVCLGAAYPETFFRDVKNSQIRDILQRISNETQEDFDNIEKIFKNLNITVHRPKIDNNDSIVNYVDCNNQLTYSNQTTYSLIPKPPMQPRDCQLVVGDKFCSTNSEIELYKNTGLDFFDDCALADIYQFDAPLVTVIGQHLIVDQKDHPGLSGIIKNKFPDRTIVPVDIGGHNDAVFAPVKPGLIVSSHYKNCYQDSFPNWEVYHIPDQSWNAMSDWRKTKHTNQEKWWVPDKENNKDFCNFVDSWISHWLGYAAETVFDVNMLVLNEQTVLVNNYHRGLFDWFKKHRIEPIITPFRHRFFWDGGIHCITSDLYREGDVETYINI